MAGIDPSAVAQARDAGYSDAEIAEHLAQSIPDIKKAREAGYSDKEIIGHLAGDKVDAAQPSGVVAALGHGVQDNIHGSAETLKQLGVGDGKDFQPDGFTPANVTNGSINPLNWNWSQVPQKIAEGAPGLVQDAAAGALAKAALGKVPYVGKAAPLIGAGLDAFLRTGGDTVKNVAAEHGHDEPTAADKLQGFGTAAASSAVGSVAPTRFIPGAGKATGVGTAGMLDAAKRYLATTAIGAGSSGASDAVNQLGVKGTIDPAQSLEAGVGGGLTAGALAAPRGAADAVGAVRRAQLGGVNADANAAYNNRLVQNAGDEGLGNSKRDFAAQENTKAGLKRELQAVDASNMNQDTANALSLAQRGAPLTADHVAAIEAADPQAGFLARQMHVAQLNEGYGSYDRANKSWSGGLSGFADKYAVRPFKSHLLIGGGSAILGAHMLGSYGLPTLGAAAGAYGIARGVDNLTGARSPASASATRFADANVPTRLAPPPAPAAPQAPPQAPQPAPWGPRPAMSPTGPSVPPPAAPPPAAPNINPVAMAMLKQTLKQNAAAQPPAAPAPEPQAPPAPTPEQQVAAHLSPIALASLKQRFKENAAAADDAAKQQNANHKAVVAQAFSENKGLDKDYGVNQAQAVSENRSADANVRAQVAQALAENRQLDKNFGANQAQAVSENKARDAAAAEEAAAEAAASKAATAALKTKITKQSGGEVKVEAAQPQAAPAATAAPAADPWSHVMPHAIPEADMVNKGKSTSQIIDETMASEKYANLPQINKLSLRNQMVGTRSARDSAISELMQQHPNDAHILMSLKDQLHEPANSDQSFSKRLIKHHTGLMSPEGARATREHFSRKDVQDAIWPHKVKRKSNAKNTESAGAS